ncbi:MAG: sugar phosphate isomerase/epimerase [Anaerolineae bacterium]
MNKLAVISSFLGASHNRYIAYQPERSLQERFALASQIEHLDGLELCYPADFADPALLRRLLGDSGLGVAAVNFRSRRSGQWMRGSFSSAQQTERQAVVDDCKRAIDLAADLGCLRITTCPLNDGHDYPFEADYRVQYAGAEEAFAAICAHSPATRISIEYKWNDPRARSLFGGVGETLAFCQAVGAPNLGVTLDFGHAIQAGERPAQSAVLLARAGRLFYVHVNDNDAHWDWDMIPGAYHLWEFVEFFYYLRALDYTDDWYGYDVLAKEHDPAETFSASLAITRKLETLAGRLDPTTISALTAERNPAHSLRYLFSLLP